MDYQVLALIVLGQLIAMLMIHRLFRKIAEERLACFEAWQATLADIRQAINELQALHDSQKLAQTPPRDTEA